MSSPSAAQAFPRDESSAHANALNLKNLPKHAPAWSPMARLKHDQFDPEVRAIYDEITSDTLSRWLDTAAAQEKRIPLAALREIPALTSPELFVNRANSSFGLFKRTVDVVTALLLGILSMPLCLLIGIAIRIDSEGSVLFRQQRVGKDERIFTLYKFRSMVDNAGLQGPLSTTRPNDPRVTRVGRVIRKLRHDEIPQLWCVLKGDMSLIGPRPELPRTHRYLSGQMPGYALRTVVRPGITGWAQVASGYADTLPKHEARLEHDLYYVRAAGIRLDFMIATRTVKVMATSKGH